MVAVLGAQIRELRLGANMTLESLSGRAGVSARTIGNIERGAITTPQHHTLTALLRALKVDDDVRAALLRLASDARLRASTSRTPVMTPPHVTDFVGRVEELRVLGRLLDPACRKRRPIGISGPAGVGKTALALESLRRVQGSPAKHLFVDLNGMGDAPLTPLQVLQSLLTQASGTTRVPVTLDEAVRMWRSATREQPLIVVLDDAGNESQIRPALSCGSELQVIVTGRRAVLGLEDIPRIALSPLERSDSIELLANIVPAAAWRAGDLDALAANCGDLPLALRIAGTRITARPTSTVEDFVELQAHGPAPLEAFVAGDRDVHAALLLSYNQLDEAARTIFTSLSALDGGMFGSAAVAAANGFDPAATERRLEDLAALGLVVQHRSGLYALHRLVRLFSAHQAHSRHSRHTTTSTPCDSDRGPTHCAPRPTLGASSAPRRPKHQHASLATSTRSAPPYRRRDRVVATSPGPPPRR